ncbi:MAG: pilin [Patescibacteria group bacterium]
MKLKHFSPLFFSTAALIAAFALWNAPSAEAACCRCKIPETSGEVCINKEAIDCNKLYTAGNPDLKSAECELESNQASCKKVADGGVCKNDPINVLAFKLPPVAATTPAASASDFDPALPNLNISIPGLSFTPAYVSDGKVVVPYLAQYIIAFQKLLMGLGLVAAALMIVYGGFLYIVSATGAKVTAGKKYIIDALVGVAIIAGSYVILINLNPSTVRMDALQLYLVKRVEMTYVSDTEYKEITGQTTVPSSNDTVRAALAVAKDMNYPDPCIVWAVVMSESGGNLKGISHDEDVRIYWPVQASRHKFIQLNTKNSGAAAGFKTADYPGEACRNSTSAEDIKKSCMAVAQQAINNDDPHGQAQIQAAIAAGDDTLGLDPRFTHGFGHGATFTMGNKCVKDGKRVTGTVLHGKCFSIADLMSAKGSAEAMMLHPAFYKNFNYNAGFETDPNLIFCTYMTGKKCTYKTGTMFIKHDLFQKCKSDPSVLQ